MIGALLARRGDASRHKEAAAQVLLLGSEAAQATAHATTTARPEEYPFTAGQTGVIEDIFLQTNGTANTATSVIVGIYALENQASSKASQSLQEVTLVGVPGTNSLLHFTGFSCPVIAGKKYALAVVSIGGTLHFNLAAASGGSRQGTYEIPGFYNLNSSWGAEKAEGTPLFYAKGKTLAAGRHLIFGLNGAKNHAATWAADHVTLNRGSPTEVVASEAGVFNKTPTEVSAGVAEMIAAGLTRPTVILNCESLLSKVNAAAFGKNAVAIVKKVREDHPTAEVIFEIVNEPQFKGPNKKSNASDYGAIVKATLEEARLAAIPTAIFYVTAFGTYVKVNAEGVSTGTFSNPFAGEGWIADMLTAQPSLKAGGANEITGWVSHNYGRAWEASSEVNGGFAAAVALRDYARQRGAGGLENWAITEFGFNETGPAEGRFVVSEAEQNTALSEYVTCACLAAQAGWLKVLSLYDDGTDEKWGVSGKTAGTTYGEKASEHGVI